MFCPYSIPLNSFSVPTIAKSSISVTLYFCCVLESILLKKAIGLLSWVITAPNCVEEASVNISNSLEKSGLVKTVSFAIAAFILLNACWWIGSHRQGCFLVLFFLMVFVSPHSPTRSVHSSQNGAILSAIHTKWHSKLRQPRKFC